MEYVIFFFALVPPVILFVFDIFSTPRKGGGIFGLFCYSQLAILFGYFAIYNTGVLYVLGISMLVIQVILNLLYILIRTGVDLFAIFHDW